MKSQTLTFILGASLLSPVWLAAESKSTVTPVLLQAPTSRCVALGQAFSGVTDDAAALSFNPASLASLSRGQLSFLYQQGAIEDHYGQLLGGWSHGNNGFGLSGGYYDAGTIGYFDGNKNTDIVAQKDLVITGGWGHRFSSLSAGMNGKYIS